MFVSCTNGFKLHGKKTIICQLNESWSDIHTCKSIDCGVPVNIANAEVIGLFKTTYNSTIYVECNEGYKPKGSNIIRCTASGVWDELSTCEMVSCGLPDIPTHASISDITGTSFQATATFKCDEGFYMDGNSVTRYQSNGLWTKYSTCKDIDDCTSSHCGNGTCVDGINSYTCACSKGFTGKSCGRRLLTDCFDLYDFDGKRTDGVYTIVTWKTHQSIQVYCDMTTDGWGWTVFQYRFNGLVEFYRNFTEYEHGFGNLNTEFWLGLNYIQEISDQGQTDIRIDLESANGTRAFEKFENFYLSSGPDFTLRLGQTTDSLHISSSFRFGPEHNGSHFTTFDRDADSWSGNCAVSYHGAWWYKDCHHANLNGRYITPGTRAFTSMSYDSFISRTALKSSRMMIRRN